MNVWVTGAAGMLGSEVVQALTAAGVPFRATDREVDITDAAAVERHGGADGAAPCWIVNCAAWTAVDDAEANEAAALALNGDGPRILAEYAAAHGSALLHISTDYVFDGTSDRPYRPDDAPAPRSAYGRTKRAGEEAIRQRLPAHVILRTAWLYGAGGRNFVATMLNLMGTRDEVRVVADQYGSPTWARDLAAAIVRVVQTPAGRYGTWHFAGAGEATWYELAEAVKATATRIGLLSHAAQVRPITTREFPTAAARPARSTLDASAFARDWACTVPTWRDGVDRYLLSLRQTISDQS